MLDAVRLICDIKKTLEQTLEISGFPKIQYSFNIQWYILKSGPKITKCQHTHCDLET